MTKAATPAKSLSLMNDPSVASDLFGQLKSLGGIVYSLFEVVDGPHRYMAPVKNVDRCERIRAFLGKFQRLFCLSKSGRHADPFELRR